MFFFLFLCLLLKKLTFSYYSSSPYERVSWHGSSSGTSSTPYIAKICLYCMTLCCFYFERLSSPVSKVCPSTLPLRTVRCFQAVCSPCPEHRCHKSYSALCMQVFLWSICGFLGVELPGHKSGQFNFRNAHFPK